MQAPTLLERTHGAVTVTWPSPQATSSLPSSSSSSSSASSSSSSASSHPSRFELQMQTDAGEWATLSASLSSSVARKRNLSAGSSYAFRVRAQQHQESKEGKESKGEENEWSAWSSASEAFSPLREEVQQMDPPVLLAAEKDAIAIQWKPVEGAEGYRLRYRSLNDIAWTEVAATITNTSAKKKNLAHGQGYVFSVLPLGAGEYEFSLGSEALHVAAEEATGVTFVAANGKTFPSSAVHNKVVGLYFSAHWCPPCRRFTPQLASLYTEAQAAGLPFEVVFVSADQTERQFREYLAEMPWKAYDFEDPNREKLQDAYQVTGIPRLVILKPDGSVIDSNAVGKPLSLATIQQWVQQAGL